MRRRFIPPVSVVRDGQHYFVVVLDPFVLLREGEFEKFLCGDLAWAIVSLQNTLDQLWNVAVQVDQTIGERHAPFSQWPFSGWSFRRGCDRRAFQNSASLFKRVIGKLKPFTSWGTRAFPSILLLLSIVSASNVWGFTGEACGRYAADYDDLRSCQAAFELGLISEVVTRVGELRHGSGQDWYLEHTDLQGETLWVDIRQLQDVEKSRLFALCGQSPCRVRLTGVARDRMITITSLDAI
jgi:hypothetical protein